jgi:hypothetical protein
MLGPEFFDSLGTSVVWQATGRNPEASPQVAMQKAMMLLEMARQPGSGLDPVKVEQAVINSMRLPMNTEELYLAQDQQPAPAVPGIEGIQPDPGMAMAPGMVPEAGIGLDAADAGLGAVAPVPF